MKDMKDRLLTKEERERWKNSPMDDCLTVRELEDTMRALTFTGVEIDEFGMTEFVDSL